MVSLRCKITLKEELGKANIRYSVSPHGVIEFHKDTTEAQLEELNRKLLNSGLELLDENDSILIDRIINTVIDMVHYSDELPRLSYKDIIGNNPGSGSESTLKIFSDVKGISIMQFIILQKIERVKELLLYEGLSLAEIARKLRYRNKDYLIAQFKKYTGLPPAYFKKLRNERMKMAG